MAAFFNSCAVRFMELTVPQDEIAAKIQGVKYIHEGVLTFCIITMLSGFVVTGQSVSKSVAEYDRSKGEKMAYRDGFAKLFLMEQYAQRDSIYKQSQERGHAA
jgi:hypothetical protein